MKPIFRSYSSRVLSAGSASAWTAFTARMQGIAGRSQRRRPGPVEAQPGGAVPGRSRPGPAVPSRCGRGPARLRRPGAVEARPGGWSRPGLEKEWGWVGGWGGGNNPSPVEKRFRLRFHRPTNPQPMAASTSIRRRPTSERRCPLQRRRRRFRGRFRSEDKTTEVILEAECSLSRDK